MMTRPLTRDAILSADDLQTESVDCPEWQGTVTIRELNGSERDSFEEGSLDKRRNLSMANIRARLVAMSAIGEDGERLFTKADAEALGKKSAAALNRCFEVSCSLSGITSDDVDELEKSSEGNPVAVLGSN